MEKLFNSTRVFLIVYINTLTILSMGIANDPVAWQYGFLSLTALNGVIGSSKIAEHATRHLRKSTDG